MSTFWQLLLGVLPMATSAYWDRSYRISGGCSWTSMATSGDSEGRREAFPRRCSIWWVNMKSVDVGVGAGATGQVRSVVLLYPFPICDPERINFSMLDREPVQWGAREPWYGMPIFVQDNSVNGNCVLLTKVSPPPTHCMCRALLTNVRPRARPRTRPRSPTV